MQKSVNPVGRPPLSRPSQLGFRLTPEALAIADRGSMVIHQTRHVAPSRSAWIRELISLLGNGPTVGIETVEQLHAHWERLQPEKASQIKITATLEERHRILLRKFECYVQSLDWSLRFGQNEALLLLIILYGETYTQLLRDSHNHT